MSKSPEERQMVKRMEHVFDRTVTELLDWCVQHNVDPSEVRLDATCLTFRTLETAEEMGARVYWAEYKAAKSLKWEHERWEELNEKYGKSECVHEWQKIQKDMSTKYVKCLKCGQMQ